MGLAPRSSSPESRSFDRPLSPSNTWPSCGGLAQFYGALLEWEVEPGDDTWCSIRADDGDSMDFQKVENFTRPQWPGQEAPQQMHLDVRVDDLDAAEDAVLALGALKHEHQPGTTFRVFLDPAGHPFCLCQG